MSYQYETEAQAAKRIAEEGWREKTNTGENRAVSPAYAAQRKFACNQDDDRPALLEKTNPRVWIFLVVMVTSAVTGLVLGLLL